MNKKDEQQTAVQQLIERNRKIQALFHNPKVDALTLRGLPAALRVKFELEERLSAKMNLVAGTQHIKFANDFLPATLLMDQQANAMSSKFETATEAISKLQKQLFSSNPVLEIVQKTQVIQKHISAASELFEQAISSKKFDDITASGALAAAIKQSRFVELSSQTFEALYEGLPKYKVKESIEQAYQIINEEGCVKQIIEDTKKRNKDKYEVQELSVVILRPIYTRVIEKWLKLDSQVSFQTFYTVCSLVYLFYTIAVHLSGEEKINVDVDINVNTDNFIEYNEHNHYYIIDNDIERIRELFELKEEGIITEEEFEAKKKELMERL